MSSLNCDCAAGWVVATVMTAAASVDSWSFAEARCAESPDQTTTMSAVMPSTAPARRNCRAPLWVSDGARLLPAPSSFDRIGWSMFVVSVGWCSECCCVGGSSRHTRRRGFARFIAAPPMNRGEDGRHEDQGRHGGEDQAADGGAAERRILFTA